jgi:hypothetical protein
VGVIKNVWIIVGLSIVGALLSVSGGNTREPILLNGSLGMTVTGVSTRIVVSITRTYNQFFSHAVFEQFAGTIIAVGSWMLAAALTPPYLDIEITPGTNKTLMVSTNSSIMI